LLEVGKAGVDHKRPGDSITAALQGPRANLAVVQLLKDHGAILFPERFDPVSAAARFGKADILDYLLKEGGTAKPSIPNAQVTGLGYAALFGYTKIADILLKAGADPNSTERQFGGGDEKVRPLALAMYAESDLGLTSCAESLRRSGADNDPTLQAEGVESIRKFMKKYFPSRADMIRTYQCVIPYSFPKNVWEHGHVPHSRPSSPVQ